MNSKQETNHATDRQPTDLMVLSMQVIKRNTCNSNSNFNATSPSPTKSCQVSSPMDGNHATSELRRLINKVSQQHGGDDPIFLSEYIDDVIHEWSHNLSKAIICFRDLTNQIQPVNNRK